MKMLTLHQPWASLIACGVKTIETRSWSTDYRGPLAIHAGKAWPVPVGEWQVPHDRGPGPYIERLIDNPVTALRRWESIPTPLGAVVAVADLVDVLPIELVLPKADRAPGVPAMSSGHDKITTHPMTEELYRFKGGDGLDVTDQRPFGDFTPGRFAWLLDNVRAVEPVPAKGHQGLRDIDPNIGAMVEAAIR